LMLANQLLKRLRHIKRIPLLGCAKRSVLLSGRTRHIDLFFSTRDRFHFKYSRTDVLWRSEQHCEILVSKLGIEINDLCKVDQSNLLCYFWRVERKDCVDDLEDDLCVLRFCGFIHFSLSFDCFFSFRFCVIHRVKSSQYVRS
jgi:hypothetical protein